MIRTFCVILLIFFLELLRRPWGIVLPTLYFEDGTTFLNQQLIADSFKFVFVPFRHGSLGDAYYLLLTKFIAYLASIVPIAYAPYILNGFGLLCVSVSTGFFSHSYFKRIIESDLLRIILCILIGVYFDGGEFFGNTTNCFWPLFFPLFIILLLDSIKFVKIYRDFIFAVLFLIIGLSTPISAIFIPFVFFKIYKEKAYRSLYLYSIIISGFIQLWVNYIFSLKVHQTKKLILFSDYITSLLNGFVYHAIIPTFHSYDISKLYLQSDFAYYYAFFIFVGIILFAYSNSKKSKYIFLISLVFLVITYAMPCFKRDVLVYFLRRTHKFSWHAPRYFFIPRIILSFIFLKGIDGFIKKRRSIFGYFPLLLFLPLILFGFDINEKLIEPKIAWSRNYHKIEEWRDQVANGRAEEFIIPIYMQPEWNINLPASISSDNSTWKWGYSKEITTKEILINEYAKLAWKEFLVNEPGKYQIDFDLRSECPFQVRARISVTFDDIYINRERFYLITPKCGQSEHHTLTFEAANRTELFIKFKALNRRNVYISNLIVKRV